ncbi:MAG: hypothetical protein NC332_05295 [Firmicutes bacterium]|nr:hypothetical protein [Bacillota bacterium]
MQTAQGFMIADCCLIGLYLPACTVISAITKDSLYGAFAFITCLTFIVRVLMTVNISKKIKYREEISTGQKICVLIFASPIAGILLLCCRENSIDKIYKNK